MPYLVELVFKFQIDWHLNLKNFIFDKFLQKTDVTSYEKLKNLSKNYFFEK